MSESEIKVGDRFLVEVEVVTLGHIGKDFMLVRGPLSETYGTNTIHREQLLLSKRIEPALKVGDKVSYKDEPQISIGHILAIDEDVTWVKFNGGSRWLCLLKDLERVP